MEDDYFDLIAVDTFKHLSGEVHPSNILVVKYNI